MNELLTLKKVTEYKVSNYTHRKVDGTMDLIHTSNIYFNHQMSHMSRSVRYQLRNLSFVRNSPN